MSHAPESIPSPSSRPDDPRPDFGAGAFEEAPTPTHAAEEHSPTSSTPTEARLEEHPRANSAPSESMLEVHPTTSAAPTEPMLVESAAPRSAPVEPPAVEPSLLTTAPPPPTPRPNVEEVEAVPVTRFDAPAPTIDVEARRAPPPPPNRPPEPAFRAEGAPPPAPNAPAPAAPSSAAPRADAPNPAPAFAASASSSPQDAEPLAASSTATATDTGSPSRIWSAFCHLFLFLAIPTLFLGGLITFLVWQLAGRKDALVTDQGREALNFQINVAVLTALLAVSCFASPLIPVVWFVAGVFCVLAALHAYRGENYRYPYIVRLVRA